MSSYIPLNFALPMVGLKVFYRLRRQLLAQDQRHKEGMLEIQS